MPQRLLLPVATAAALLATASPASAVDLALVLLTDVSGSMDDDEFAMVKHGYQAAFQDPDVIAALQGNPGGIAVAYVEFSSRDTITTVVG